MDVARHTPSSEAGPGPDVAPVTLPEAPDFLCERCGYILGGLPTGVRRCPECGLPIAESRPERRTGSPWQLRPSVGAWLATDWQAMRRPRRLFGLAAMSRDGSAGLLRANLLAASLILGVGWCGHLLRLELFIAVFPEAWWRVPISAALVAMLIGVPACYLLLWTLTWIETRGIGFLGRRRGWRITPDVAWAVCAHASGGWVLAAALATAGIVAVWAFDIQAVRAVAPGILVPDPTRPWRAPVGGFLVGLGAFEVLVNIGLRRCRYAAPAGPQRTSAGPDAGCAPFRE